MHVCAFVFMYACLLVLHTLILVAERADNDRLILILFNDCLTVWETVANTDDSNCQVLCFGQIKHQPKNLEQQNL